jgi:glycosyltransferase involved in cell wall biosynthesis
VNRLRVVMVTRRFWPLVGGPEKLLANLAVELSGRGCQVTVVTARWQPHWPRDIRFHNVPVIRLDHAADHGWGNVHYLRRLARWLRGNQDHLDLVCVSQLKHDAYTAIRAVGRNTPVVLRAERSGPGGDCRWQRRVLCGRRIAAACHRATAVIAADGEIQRELLASGYPSASVHAIANGVPEMPPRSRETRQAARTVLAESNGELELSAAAQLAVYAGRIEPDRGLERLIDVWEPIARRRHNARLWLVGDGSLRRALRRRIESLNLQERVMLVGVFDQVDEVLAAADLLVRPTVEAGSSMAILEGMAAGLPVVASDVPGHREWVGHEQDGLLVPPEDPAAWSAAIGRLLDEPELSARLGGAARQKTTQFSLAKTTSAHLTLFQGLCR